MSQGYIVPRFRTSGTGEYDQGLRNLGYDPEQYEVLDEEEYAAYLAEDWSKLESLGMGVASNIGGGVGAAGLMLGAGAALSATGAGALVGIPTMIGAGLVGAWAGNEAQGKIGDAVYSDAELEALQSKRRDAELANPLSYFGGQMTPALLSFRPSPAQLGKAGRGLGQAFTGRAVGLGEKQALSQMGIGAGFDTAIEGGRQIVEGEFDPAKLGMAAAVGATLQRPTFKPMGMDALLAKGRQKAYNRTKSKLLPTQPERVFDIWAEPIPSTAELKASIKNVGITSIYNQGKIWTGNEGVKVGIVENAATPTPHDVASQIENFVTRGVGILDPTKPGPAAQALGTGGGVGGTRGTGVGFAPLTLAEAAAAQGVSPKTAREVYGLAATKEAEAVKLREEGIEELKIAKAEEATIGDPGVTHSKREKDRIKAGVRKAEKKIAKADKQLGAAITPAEKTAISKLFSEQAKETKILDPVTGKPRKVRVAEVPPEFSMRIVDRNGEPLHERADVFPKPRAEEQLDPVRLRRLANGRLQKSILRRDGKTGWVFIKEVEGDKIQKQFLDHVAGIRKNMEKAKAELEASTGKSLPPIKPEDVDLFAMLALVRGFNLAQATSDIHIGQSRHGKLAGGMYYHDTRTITFDPRRMQRDAINHEGFHGFLHDLQYSTNKKDQALRDKFIKLFASEEEGVEFLGKAFTKRILNNKRNKFKELLREAKLRWKDRFGMKLSHEQLKEYLLIKYEHDQPFLSNYRFIDGFIEKRLGKKPTKADDVGEYYEKRQKLLLDVQAGKPVTGTMAGAFGSEPWLGLDFQAAKRRFNAEGEEEVAATPEEMEEGFRKIKENLGMDTKPSEGSGADVRRIINKALWDSGQDYQEAASGKARADEGFLFASGRDRAQHMVETFDKFGTNLKDFDPERQILTGGTKDRRWYSPMRLIRGVQYLIAETDQLLVRPFKGLQNAEITDSTKRMALYARDAHNRLEMMEKRYVTRFIEPIIMAANKLGLSKKEKAILGEFRTLRRLVKKKFDDVDSMYMTKHNDRYKDLMGQVLMSNKLSAANKLLDDLYINTREEQIANGPKVWKGNQLQDASKGREGYYDPFMLSRDATAILKRKPHTKEGKELQDKIVKFWLDQQTVNGKTEVELRDDLAEYIAVISNKDSFIKTTGETVDLTSASKFNALRKTEGLLLPPELVDVDPFIKAQRYVGRFAKDMAWFTQIEDDHIMRAIRDLRNQENKITHRQTKIKGVVVEPTTPTLKEIFGDDVDTAYGSRAEKTFRNLDETHAGFHEDIDIQVLRFNRMITSQWLGALSGVRDLTTSFLNNLPYMRTQDLPLLLKSLTHLGDAWKQSHISGANRSKMSAIEFAHDSIDRSADMMASVADFSQKYSGRELFERGTRAIQFNLGKLLMRSYLNSGGGDPHVQRVLNTMGRMADVDTGRLQKNPTTVTEGDLNKLATAFTEINQGTYGARGVPTAMIRGKSSYFLSLSRWSVEKFNRYMKDVILPTMGEKKDFKPLVKATLGTAVVGEALQEIANLMNAKESYEPSIAELVEGEADAEEFVYHAMHIANLAGFFGVLSGLGNDALRMFFTGKAAVEDVSAVTFPGLEAMFLDKGLVQSLFSYGTSGNASDPTTILRTLEDVITNLNQSLRITRNQLLANTPTGKFFDDALDMTYFKSRKSEMDHKKMERDLKVFNRLYRGQHTSRWFPNVDRYANTPARQFKNSITESDMYENAKSFVLSSWKKSMTKAGLDKGRFKRLLAEGYARAERLSPKISDDFTLREAANYADFIGRLRGTDGIVDVIKQEQKDKALAQERKRIVMETLSDEELQARFRGDLQQAVRRGSTLLPTR